jgi:hypothetical protein
MQPLHQKPFNNVAPFDSHLTLLFSTALNHTRQQPEDDWRKLDK